MRMDQAFDGVVATGERDFVTVESPLADAETYPDDGPLTPPELTVHGQGYEGEMDIDALPVEDAEQDAVRYVRDCLRGDRGAAVARPPVYTVTGDSGTYARSIAHALGAETGFLYSIDDRSWGSRTEVGSASVGVLPGETEASWTARKERAEEDAVREWNRALFQETVQAAGERDGAVLLHDIYEVFPDAEADSVAPEMYGVFDEIWGYAEDELAAPVILTDVNECRPDDLGTALSERLGRFKVDVEDTPGLRRRMLAQAGDADGAYDAIVEEYADLPLRAFRDIPVRAAAVGGDLERAAADVAEMYRDA